MDPNQAYGEMILAMKLGEHAEARELALSLQTWYARGGFYPPQVTETTMVGSILYVLRHTLYLTIQD